MAGDPNPSGTKIRAQLFVDAYLRNGNHAGKAAEEAGYSARSARVQGPRLLKRPDIIAMLAERGKQVMTRQTNFVRDRQLEPGEVSARLFDAQLATERWAAEVACIAHFDPGELYDEAGCLIPLHKLPEHVRRAISTIEATTDKDGNTTYKVKPWDKNTAIVTAGKHLGTFERDNSQKPAPIQVNIRLVG